MELWLCVCEMQVIRRYSDFDLLNNSLMVSYTTVQFVSTAFIYLFGCFVLRGSNFCLLAYGCHARRSFPDSPSILSPEWRSLSSVILPFSSSPWLSFFENGGCSKPAHIVCLNRSLSVQVCGISLLLPPKKLIGNMDRDFIAERQRGLQAYLDSVTQHPLLSSSLPVKKFLDPNSYSANYTGIAAW